MSRLNHISVFPRILALAAAALWAATGCDAQLGAPARAPTRPQGGHHEAGDHDHEEGHGHHHAHGEKGPHGGALVAIGNDAAHLEIVLDAETGKVTAYVLDAEAKESVLIKAESLEIAFTKEHSHDDHEHEEGEEGHKHDEHDDSLPETATLALSAVAAGNQGASEFTGQTDALKGATEFDAVLTTITIGGNDFTNVKFNYPEGNEHDHHHHH